MTGYNNSPITSDPEGSDFMKWEQECALWKEIVGPLEAVSDDPMLYHEAASLKSKQGESIWWVREKAASGVIIDFFEEDVAVGTIFVLHDKPTVDVLDRSGQMRCGLPLSHAVELVELDY